MRESTLSPISCLFSWCCCCRQRSSGGWFCNRKQRTCSEREDKSYKHRSCQGVGFGVAVIFSKASQQPFWRQQTALGMEHQEQQLLDSVVQDSGPELDVNQQTTRHNVNISQGNHKAPENPMLFYQLWEKHHNPDVCGHSIIRRRLLAAFFKAVCLKSSIAPFQYSPPLKEWHKTGI